MYIDKGKLLPALKARRYQLMESAENEQGSLIVAVQIIDTLIDEIEHGFYDWQQGSE